MYLNAMHVRLLLRHMARIRELPQRLGFGAGPGEVARGVREGREV